MEKKSFEELIEKSERKSKWRTVIFTVLPVILGLFFVLYLTKTYYSSKEKIDIEKDELILEVDSVKTINEIQKNIVTIGTDSEIKSILERDQKRIEKKAIISKYFTLITSREKDSLQEMYSDTLIRYFRKRNVPKKNAWYDQKYSWETYPEQKIKNISLSFCDNDESVVWVNLEYSIHGEEFRLYWFKFILDQNNNINYLRSFDIPKTCMDSIKED